MHSYEYEKRTGVEEITWPRFAQLCHTLAEALGSEPFDLIIGNARAGLFPATAVACALRCELYPVRLTRRDNDQVVRTRPVWKVNVPRAVAGRDVVVIDEIADTGETVALLKRRCLELGAERVRTASLVAHSWANPQPDVVAMASDALIIFPWDKIVFTDGEWKPHPELARALAFHSKNSPNG
jgi:hypoxanthine phosphoribosyltransferase